MSRKDWGEEIRKGGWEEGGGRGKGGSMRAWVASFLGEGGRVGQRNRVVCQVRLYLTLTFLEMVES